MKYAVHPSVAHGRAILERLPETTGKPKDQWLRLLKQQGRQTSRERTAWLKSDHQMGGTTARLLAEISLGETAINDAAYLKQADEFVAAMFTGKRSGLKPIYEKLLNLVRGLGGDIRVCPCKTMVPVYRAHVIAQLKPATQKRLDLGLALRGAKRLKLGRLRETGGLQTKDRITHQVSLESVDDLDTDVLKWLQSAYQLDPKKG